MERIEILVHEARGIRRDGYIIEQGVPVEGLRAAEVDLLGVFDESGAAVPAGIEAESLDPNGMVRWLRLSLPVDVAANSRRTYTLADAGIVGDVRRLTVETSPGAIRVENGRFSACFWDQGTLKVSGPSGTVIDGQIDFSLQGDVRSKYGRLIPVKYQPGEFRIVTASPTRIHIANKGRYLALEPKETFLSETQHYDVDLEFIIHADSPVIKYRWRITNHMRFNCNYMWLSQYAIKFPLRGGSVAVSGARSPEGDKLADWAHINTPGGSLGIAFPQQEWFGRGAGISMSDGWLMQGGINPPVDGGFGERSPSIWRQFYYGMSRTFEGALVIDGTEEQARAEAKPIPLVLPGQYYSDLGILPENGALLTWGPWKDVVARTAENLLKRQWKGTLWCGEWWREWDVVTNQGTQETHSGNSGLGVLYHFYRTGDWRFWESAKMSYYYTFDIQFCKQEDGPGPYMHTRRFMLDHQEWFHPRYQRISTLVKVGHLLGDTISREKVLWYLRWWGDNYVAEDGAPMAANPNGSKSKCNEAAMSNFAESLCYAYEETGDNWFLEKAMLLGDWVIKGFDTDTTGQFIHNDNDTRYVLRGLIALCQVTEYRKFIDAFCRIALWTARYKGSVPNHLWFLAQAYKWSGDEEILAGLKRLVDYLLAQENPEEPGAFLQPQIGSVPPYPDCIWDDFYTKKAVVSYLPFVAGVLGL